MDPFAWTVGPEPRCARSDSPTPLVALPASACGSSPFASRIVPCGQVADGCINSLAICATASVRTAPPTAGSAHWQLGRLVD
eukprot:3143346-Alexandrium_andersonii.AAC.1